MTDAVSMSVYSQTGKDLPPMPNNCILHLHKCMYREREREREYLCMYVYLFTPWSGVLLAKLTSFQLVKKFPKFYGTQRFITAFTSA
jgi:hypothetical protein